MSLSYTGSAMNSIYTIYPDSYPPLLKQIPDLPQKLYLRGTIPSDPELKFLTIVGSRKYTEYGKLACENLVSGLKGLPIIIVSGLAYGIDSIAHETALKVGLKTIAIPGSAITDNKLYPAANRNLAQRILDAGGVLLSPFDETVFGKKWIFPFRNRIMAGISHATLVIEADLPSGTLITSKYATEFNREVCAVPGSIFSKQSAGPHMLIGLGAIPISSSADIIKTLGLKKEPENQKIDYSGLTEDETMILKALINPLSRDTLIKSLSIPISRVSAALSMLEIKGLICERLGELSRV